MTRLSVIHAIALTVSLVCVSLVSVPTNAAEPEAKTLLTADFERDGWTLAAPKGKQAVGCQIQTTRSVHGQDKPAFVKTRALYVEHGYWHSPKRKAKPYGYYRVRFLSKAAQDAHVAAVFYDKSGEPLVQDDYDLIRASEAWRESTLCFRAHPDARSLRVRFHANGTPLMIDDVRLEAISTDAALAWIDRLSAANPLMRFQPPPDRGKYLPRTFARLAAGKTLRIVMLGDSICNDTSNSLFELPLEREWPGADIRVVTSVRGGTGCTYYQHENRIESYVLRYKPHLLIIAGISHGYDVAAIRNVIQQIRKKSQCEVLVLSGAIAPENCSKDAHLRFSDKPLHLALERCETFHPRLRRMAFREQVEYFDMRKAWNDYLRRSPRPLAWFQRDPIHANARGKMVLGRLLMKYLQPKAVRPERPSKHSVGQAEQAPPMWALGDRGHPLTSVGSTQATTTSQCAGKWSAISGSTKPYPCRRAQGTIELDGKLDEPAWDRAPVITDFAQPWKEQDGKRPVTHQARARMLWDDEFLYVAGELDDLDIFSDVTEHDGQTWSGDVFEVFLKPSPEQGTAYYEFHVTPANVQFDILFLKRDLTQVKQRIGANRFHLESAVRCDGSLNQRDDTDRGWTVELRIPWSDLAPTGGAPGLGDRWRFAICRYDFIAGREDPILSTAAPLTGRNFHLYEDFPKMHFVR